jgi:hypothetical protein
MRNPFPTALATLSLLCAGTALAAPHHRPTPRLDLSMPNFASPQWQERLQGPPIDHDYTSMESVIVTPSETNKSYVTVAPAGVGSLYWALRHPTESWRILAPAQSGDEFNTEREIALAYNDPLSDCPGFPGTPNVRPECN